MRTDSMPSGAMTSVVTLEVIRRKRRCVAKVQLWHEDIREFAPRDFEELVTKAFERRLTPKADFKTTPARGEFGYSGPGRSSCGASAMPPLVGGTVPRVRRSALRRAFMMLSRYGSRRPAFGFQLALQATATTHSLVQPPVTRLQHGHAFDISTRLREGD